MKLESIPHLVLFDLDGTLADTAAGLHEASSIALEAIGYKGVTIDETRSYLGNGPYMLLARAIAHSQNPANSILESEELQKASAVFNDVYATSCTRGDKVFAGVVEGLKTLGEFGIKRAVVTNKPHQFVEAVLNKNGLLPHIDYFLGSGVIKEKKPDPKPLLYVCDQFNISTKHTVMVGDSWNDIEAAKNAGIISIGLTYGYNRGVSIRESNPDYCFNDFKDVIALLTQCN